MTRARSHLHSLVELTSTLAPTGGCLPCRLAQDQGVGQFAKTPAGPTATPEAARVRWAGVLGVEGELTGDGRLIEPNALRWEDLPLKIRYVAQDVGAHDGAVVVGNIESIERREQGVIWGEGWFDTGSDAGREAIRQVDEELTTGVSLDLDDVSFEVRVAGDLLDSIQDTPAAQGEDKSAWLPLAGEEQEVPVGRQVDENGRVTVQQMNADDEVRVTTDGRIRAATIVAIPAFASAQIALTSSPEEQLAKGKKAKPDDDDEPVEVDDEALEHEEDPDADYNWVEDVGGLPTYIARISKHLIEKGMSESHAIATAVNAVKKMCATGDLNFPGKQDVNPGSRAEACAAVASWEEKKARANASAGHVLTAAAATRRTRYPVAPPELWFSEPPFEGPHPVQVTEEGEVLGHIALWDTCHLSHTSQGRCVTPPHSSVGYPYFRLGAVRTAEGSDVPVGHLTIDTRHAADDLSAAAALTHYENTGTTVADVAAGEDSWGIWIHGAVRPRATPDQVRALRSAPISGDWRRIGRSLELIAALGVNVPGYPVPRPSGLVRDGRPYTLVASGMLPPTRVIPPSDPASFLTLDDLRYLKRLATREKEHEALVAAATPAPPSSPDDLARRVQASRLAMRVRRASLH